MKKRIRKINTLAFTKLHVVIFGIAGIVAGIVYSFGGLIIDVLVSAGWIVTNETPGLSYGTVLAFGALVGMPAIFAAVGLLVGAVGALLYNLFAKWFGGSIELDLGE